ncbi:glycosyltransferase [Paraburkholderia silviterrae]|uniref:Glycosyltransferase family 1 protein n=1 Tax=Paraburkholderia silviterrae TaxID=2528715 RepID=A0A4R5M9V8_9BURK|nr:glycosyltransferase [Paraburkholderia silviterrae]TDG23141.1 glycosyltransferase family 1 protein [Paraburkholderia silviterrae]
MEEVAFFMNAFSTAPHNVTFEFLDSRLPAKQAMSHLRISRKISMNSVLTLLKFLSYPIRRPVKRASRISAIHTITHRVFSPEGGKGGGSAVQSCQQILLKDRHGDLALKYSYFENNRYWENWDPRLADLWAGAFFAISKTKDESDAAYITHDYATAFGLAILGKKFVYVSHLQGPRVEEKYNYNEKFTRLDRRIVNFCERFVFKRAHYVCFPSVGAKDYYFASPYRSLEQKHVRIGPVLYNTLYADPIPERVSSISEDRESLTFISVGALTSAKGIDQLPAFFDEFLKMHTGNVRWIVVGNGPLKEQFLHVTAELAKRHDRLAIHLVESCAYSQVRYLMSISDVYIMFHRISIFDLATLEAMKDGKCIVLSNVGGNPEFNKTGNIIFHESDNRDTATRLTNANILDLKSRNKSAYERYFSNTVFVESYHGVIDDLRRSANGE